MNNVAPKQARHPLKEPGETPSRTTHTTMNCKENDWSSRPDVSTCIHLHARACMHLHAHACRVSLGWGSGRASACRCMHMDDDMVEWCPMTQREECGGTYIGVSECTRREEYDGIGGGSKWGCRFTAVWSHSHLCLGFTKACDHSRTK